MRPHSQIMFILFPSPQLYLKSPHINKYWQAQFGQNHASLDASDHEIYSWVAGKKETSSQVCSIKRLLYQTETMELISDGGLGIVNSYFKKE